MGYLTTTLQGAVGASVALNLAAANSTNNAIAAAYAADPSAFEQGASEYVYGAPPVTQAGARELSSRMTRLFTESSKIRFSMAPSSGDGPGSADGIGGPLGGSGRGDDDDGNGGNKSGPRLKGLFSHHIETGPTMNVQGGSAFHTNMAWDMTNNEVAIIFHAKQDPGDHEWNCFIEDSNNFAHRGNKAIIFSEGGMPTPEQRSDLTRVHKEWSNLKKDPKIAIICKVNIFVRMCTSIINVLHGGGRRLKFFENLEDGSRWLGLDGDTNMRVRKVLSFLKIGLL